MPDSLPPDLTNEAVSAFVRAAGLVVDTVTATEVAGHLEVGADHHTRGASCTAACISPRSSRPPVSVPAPPSVTAASSRSAEKPGISRLGKLRVKGQTAAREKWCCHGGTAETGMSPHIDMIS
jgi:hypothetical protein